MSLFRRGPARQELEAQIERTHGVVAILSLSRANLESAQSLLKQAQGHLARDDTIRAKDACERAERIAFFLESDYVAARQAVETIKAHAERAKAAGMATAEESRALEAIHERAISTRALEGVTVPDYAGARALAEEALLRSEAARGLADGASDAIFAVEMALDDAAETLGSGAEEVLRESRSLVETAHAELSNGAPEVAARHAAAAERLAADALEQRGRALETAESVERLSVGLRSLGIPVATIARSLDVGRTLLAKGKLSAANDVLNEAVQDAVRVGQEYRALLDAMSAASKEIEALRAEGLSTAEAEAVLARAKGAMKSGNYRFAATTAAEVHRVAVLERESREALRAQLEEAKAQIRNLRDLGLADVDDVEEMVGRAERSFEEGDYATTSEDLRIAGLFVRPAAKSAGKEPAVPR